MGLFDILLIGAAGLGAAYFFNIGGLKQTVDNLINNFHIGYDPCEATRYNCPSGQIQAWSDNQQRCVCGPLPL